MTSPSGRDPHQTFLWGWACALTACILSPVRTVSSDAAGIALQYEAAPYEHVIDIAERHCRQFGKIAWPTENTIVGDAYHHLQRFECRARAPEPAKNG